MKRWPYYQGDIEKLHGAYAKRIQTRMAKFVVGKSVGNACRNYVADVKTLVSEGKVFVAKPKRLREIAIKFENAYFNRCVLPKWAKRINTRLIKEVFQYENFAKAVGNSRNEWGGVPLMEEILKSNRYCPYCNADSIMAIRWRISRKARTRLIKAAFDHYFPQKRYPVLSMSLYNLIPSCFRCNSQLKKGDFAFALSTLSPFEVDFHNVARFVPVIDSPSLLHEACSSKGVGVRLCACRSMDEKVVRAYNDLFRLERVYSDCYGREVLDVIHKSLVLNESYVSVLEGWFAKAGVCGVDVRRLLYGASLDPANIDQQRLSKMTIDIHRQFSGLPKYE